MRVLLDRSHNNGHLVFLTKDKPMMCPYSKRLVPQSWNTLNGISQRLPRGGGIAQPPPECNSGTKNWISPTSIKYTTIGMYASVVVLISKTGTCPSRAPSNGGTTRICSHVEMHNSSLWRDMIRAQKVCSRQSYQLGGTPDGVGRRVMD